MEFQEMMTRAGMLTQNIGNQIMVAAEKEDVAVLHSLANQLREIMDILNVITLADKMARAARDN